MVHAEVGDEAGEVRALLESGELILRGVIRRTIRDRRWKTLPVESEGLRFSCAGEVVRLHLGARTVSERLTATRYDLAPA